MVDEETVAGGIDVPLIRGEHRRSRSRPSNRSQFSLGAINHTVSCIWSRSSCARPGSSQYSLLERVETDASRPGSGETAGLSRSGGAPLSYPSLGFLLCAHAPPPPVSHLLFSPALATCLSSRVALTSDKWGPDIERACSRQPPSSHRLLPVHTAHLCRSSLVLFWHCYSRPPSRAPSQVRAEEVAPRSRAETGTASRILPLGL